MRKRNPYYIFQLAILAAVIVLWATGSDKMTFASILILMRQASTLGFISTGLGLILITGSVDLSCGALVSLGSVICTMLITHNTPAFPAILLTLCICGTCGLVNGLLTVSLSFPAAIITLAMSVIYVSLAYILRTPATFNVQKTQLAFLSGKVFFMPMSFVLFLVVFLLAVFLIQNTYMGKYMVAIGDNEYALKRMGIRTKGYRILAYAMCGVCSGIAGICMVARISGRVTGDNLSLLMQGYTALALAGIGFFKVQRNFLFIGYGVVVVSLLQYTLTTANVSSDWQNIVLELLFLTSIGLFQLFRKLRGAR